MARYVDIEPYEDCRIILHKEDVGFPCRDLPAADVEEVVRCKNCKHCERIDDHELWCRGRGVPSVLTPPKDYCSKGAKMDGGKE